MPTEIRCPSCNRQLKVPENLLGKMVRCPGCQQTFTATAESAPAPVQPRPSAAPPASRRPAPPPEDEPEEGVQEEAPVRRRRPAADEYEEAETEPEAYEDEDEDRPRRRRVRSSEAAGMVSGPAIALMVVGVIDVISGVLGLVMNMLGVGLAAGQAGAGRPGAAGGGNDAMLQMAMGIPSNLITLVFAALILFGAIRMKNLQSYGLALTACILAMIPCVNCCLLGLPFGIWGIVMLNRPEVKEAFT